MYEELWVTIQAGRVWRGRLVNRSKDGRLYVLDRTNLGKFQAGTDRIVQMLTTPGKAAVLSTIAVWLLYLAAAGVGRVMLQHLLYRDLESIALMGEQVVPHAGEMSER